MKQRDIRPERSIERFSRGLELVRAIRRMWKCNEKVHNNQLINSRIQAIVDEYDLRLPEWFYWCDLARGA